jgi:hypothetical protein
MSTPTVFDAAPGRVIHLKLLYGESLAEQSSQGTGVLYPGQAVPITPYRAFMLNSDGAPTRPLSLAGGAPSQPGGFDAAAATALIPLREGFVGAAPYSRGNNGQGTFSAHLAWTDRERRGRAMPRQLYGALSGGRGGATLDTLRKGGPLVQGISLYSSFLAMVTRFVQVATVGGFSVVIDNVRWLQGINEEHGTPAFVPGDATWAAGVASYKTGQLQLFTDLRADLKAITGQATAPDVVMVQTAGSGQGRAKWAAQAQYEVARDDPPDWLLPAGSHLWAEYASTSHHSTKGQVQMGEQFGIADAARDAGGRPNCLVAKGITLSGAAFTVPTWDVGAQALVTPIIDTVSMPEMPDSVRGFKLTSGNGAVIQSVTRTSTGIIVTADKVPTTPRLSYAETGPGNNYGTDENADGNGAGTGRAGQWGNVRGPTAWSQPSRLVPGFTQHVPLWSFGWSPA